MYVYTHQGLYQEAFRCHVTALSDINLGRYPTLSCKFTHINRYVQRVELLQSPCIFVMYVTNLQDPIESRSCAFQKVVYHIPDLTVGFGKRDSALWNAEFVGASTLDQPWTNNFFSREDHQEHDSWALLVSEEFQSQAYLLYTGTPKKGMATPQYFT